MLNSETDLPELVLWKPASIQKLISIDEELMKKPSEPSEVDDDPELVPGQLNYTVRFFVSLLINALLLDLYAIQIYSEHVTCLSESGADSTALIKKALLIGLFPLLADIVVSNICSIYYRARATRDA